MVGLVSPMDAPIPFPTPSTLVLRQQLAEAGDSAHKLKSFALGIIREVEMERQCSFCPLLAARPIRVITLPVLD